MPHVTIGYAIMLPLLILQIFLFPLTAGWLMDIWVDARRTLALQDAASHLGSTIQQLYFSLNHETISTGTATYSPGLPPLIENCYYTGKAVLKDIAAATPNSSRILLLTLALPEARLSVTTQVILGPNVFWESSSFISNSTRACVSAQKNETGITLSFGEREE